jgi:hypothetical protein
MTQAPKRAVRRIEHQIADARIVKNGAPLAGGDVELDNVAIGVIVFREPRRLALRIVGKRGDAIEHLALDIGQMPDRAGARRQHADMADHARIAEGADQVAGMRVDEGARDRAERARLERRHLRFWISAHRGQVVLLEGVLPGDPVLPGLV